MKKQLKHLRNPVVIRYIVGIFIGALIIVGYMYFKNTYQRLLVENSLIQAPIVHIAPTAAGKLLETTIAEGDHVKKGDPLATVGNETLRAATDGIVIMANNQIGSVQSGQTSVIDMINPNNMRVVATIDENKGLNKVKVGQATSFTVDALPGKTFWGYVDEISPSARQTQLSFSISSERPVQQFDVFIHFDVSAHPEIKNGMSAKSTIYTNKP